MSVFNPLPKPGEGSTQCTHCSLRAARSRPRTDHRPTREGAFRAAKPLGLPPVLRTQPRPRASDATGPTRSFSVMAQRAPFPNAWHASAGHLQTTTVAQMAPAGQFRAGTQNQQGSQFSARPHLSASRRHRRVQLAARPQGRCTSQGGPDSLPGQYRHRHIGARRRTRDRRHLETPGARDPP